VLFRFFAGTPQTNLKALRSRARMPRCEPRSCLGLLSSPPQPITWLPPRAAIAPLNRNQTTRGAAAQSPIQIGRACCGCADRSSLPIARRPQHRVYVSYRTTDLRREIFPARAHPHWVRNPTTSRSRAQPSARARGFGTAAVTDFADAEPRSLTGPNDQRRLVPSRGSRR
jgi:hypothetical protein